ncbi:DUF418 domain-containing protein [Lysinibacillus pakistanensis]|uniref:DUF418 domain-containing protein n=1 Tax=Lysinibacillus pakistanensis TaxID=759811 RepID=A0AAX3WP37_9BACI|nr:DUF418 domain-containing protein [Lysinibacillus pakistanensis]MDM5233823.1 DUF418 domain-containing protein [Lysinibacillus pakistanensis]WHY44440.1 DUF418 domain-containing protein [Lysinibacillus pakistanensis]WHY49449.1 DUF418 domain-containing protein [Lysinibacillus pakistanensis]
MQPIDLNKRIDTLDYLRGFALLGIILVNIPGLLWIEAPKRPIDIAYHHILMLFVEGKFFTIFSFLFGVGFYIFIARAYAKNEKAFLLFIRRIILLFLIGLVHAFFHPGEALTVYAIFGLLALPFYKVRKEINLTIGLILLAITAYYGIKIAMPLPLILLGLAAGQYRIFENLNVKRKKIIVFTIMMFFISIGGWLYQWNYVPSSLIDFNSLTEEEFAEHITNIEQFSLIGLQFSPFVSAFYVGLIILLLQLPFFKFVLSPLKGYGRMALTNYLGQTALILFVGHAFQLIGNISYIQSLWICLGIYIIQLLFSRLWLKFFQFGPFEWLWRMGTYWTVPSKFKSSREF